MKSRLRELAEKANDFGDHGHDSQAGTPKESTTGQGAGGKYTALGPQVVGGAPAPAKSPFKNISGGK